MPDLLQADAFFQAFGLDTRCLDGAVEIRTFNDAHMWLKINCGPQKRLEQIVFGAYPDDLEPIAGRLETMKVLVAELRTGEKLTGLRFRDPVGTAIEVRAAGKVMPDAKAQTCFTSCPAGERGAAMKGQTPRVRPSRMSHALFFTPDITTSVAFYQEALGLRISDFPGPVAFMHGAHGSDHHLIAFAQCAIGIGYHHSAWDVATLDEVGLGAGQMAAAGFDRGWGLGRHVLGSNYFHYVRDPWGSYAEYSFDIDYIPAETEWRPGYPSAENSFYLWGPQVPEDFVTNYERHSLRTGD
ncbi:VOC family protein (plasmid) [Novosphingobium sp. BL-8A]